MQILNNDFAFENLTTSWRNSITWLVGKFVIMPDHVHLFCAPTYNSESLESWVQYWKRHFTRCYNRQFEPATNILVWQKAFWDTQMRNQDHYCSQWDYVQDNPIRAKLVKEGEEWKYKGEINYFQF